MNGFFSMGTVLKLFSDGRFFRSLSAWVLRLCAVVIGIFMLVGWIKLWADLGDLDGIRLTAVPGVVSNSRVCGDTCHVYSGK